MCVRRLRRKRFAQILSTICNVDSQWKLKIAMSRDWLTRLITNNIREIEIWNCYWTYTTLIALTYQSSNVVKNFPMFGGSQCFRSHLAPKIRNCWRREPFSEHSKYATNMNMINTNWKRTKKTVEHVHYEWGSNLNQRQQSTQPVIPIILPSEFNLNFQHLSTMEGIHSQHKSH